MNKNQVLLHFTDESMLGGYGYISKITEIFFQKRISIDSMSSDEIGFTFSIEKKDCTKDLINELKKINRVNMIDNVAKISIVGSNLDSNLISQIFNIINGDKIYSISHSASFNNITIFVDDDKGEKIIKALHQAIFANGNR